MSQQDFYTAWGEYIDNSNPTVTTAAPTTKPTVATMAPTAKPTVAKTIVPQSDKFASVKPTATACPNGMC